MVGDALGVGLGEPDPDVGGEREAVHKDNPRIAACRSSSLPRSFESGSHAWF
jgi:hypothetical protein